jgi:hypothetical protein
MPKKIKIQQRLCEYMRNHGFVIDRRNNFEKYTSAQDLHNLIQNPTHGTGSPSLKRLSLYGLTHILETDLHLSKRPRFNGIPLFESSEENVTEYSYVLTVPNPKDNPWKKDKFS